MTDQDIELVKPFAGGICERRVHMPQYCTEFIVMPVWGGFERSNNILGIFYQHEKTANHCSLVQRGVGPREIASNGPVMALDILVPNATMRHTNVAAMDGGGSHLNVLFIFDAPHCMHLLQLWCQARLQARK